MINCSINILNNETNTWEALTTAIYPIKFTERLDKELDSGSFEYISSSSKIYPPFTKCRITVDSVKKYFYLSDSASWTVENIWRHVVVLTEPTKILEGYTLSGLAVTQPIEAPTQTLYDVLDRLLDVTPLRRVNGEARPFNITTNSKIVELLQNTYAPEYRWGSQTNLWEAVADIGAYIDAMPRLIPNANDDRVFGTITFDLINEVTELIETLSYSQRFDSIDETQYCSALETDAENLIASNANEASLVFPAPNGWITPRSENVRLTTDNCDLILPFNIERLTKVWVNGEDVSLHLNTINGSSAPDKTLAEVGVAELDITSVIKEMAEWSALETTRYNRLGEVAMSDFTNNTWNYELHSNKIMLRNEFDIVGSVTVTQLVLGSAAVRKLSNGEIINDNYVFEYDGVKYGINSCNTKTPINVRFRVEYNSLDSSSKMRTVKTEKVNTHFIQQFNQRSEINSAQFFARNMKGTVDRMGVPSIEVFKQFKDINSSPKTGSAWVQENEIYIVTAVSSELWSEIINVNIAMSKNWSLLSQYIAIDRKYRNWNIPAEILQRNIYICDYCVIADKYIRKTGFIATMAILQILNVFKCRQFKGFTEINNIFLAKDDSSGVVISANSFSAGTSLLISAKTKDNLSAGIMRDREITGDNYTCTDVYYTQKDGTLETAFLSAYSEISRLNTEVFPSMTVPHGSTPGTNIPAGIMLLGDLNLILKKDKAEQLNFTYQLHFVTQMSDVVIGPQFCIDCPLVQQFTADKKIRFWGLTNRIAKNAVKVLSSQGTIIADLSNDSANTYFSISHITAFDCIELIINSLEGNYTGWAITDDKNNLILAQNKSLSEGSKLYMNFLANY